MFILCIFSVIGIDSITTQAQGIVYDDDGCEQSPYECANSFFTNANLGEDIPVFWFGEYDGCPPEAICYIGPRLLTNDDLKYFIAPSGDVSESVCDDLSIMYLGTPDIFARGRLNKPYHSLTCATEGDFLSVDLIIVHDNTILHLAVQGTSTWIDPLPILQNIMGGDIDHLIGDVENPANDTQSGVDLSACSGLDETADAQCLADLALENDDYDLCAAALDAYACGATILEQVDDPCADLTGEDELSCRIEFATDTGIEAACEPLPADAQGTCFVFAASTSGDLSLVERRFPPGDERDTVYSVIAVTLKDPSILEEIDDNYNYDGARVMLMLPMVLETGEAPPDDYCETLRGNYDRDFGDYPEDATLHYDACGRLIAIAQQMSTMSEDELAEFLITELRNTGNPEDAAFADQMEAAFESLEDE